MDKKTKVKNKKKGPLRLEAILPLVIVLVLGGLYAHFFFDAHLKSAVQWGASKVHGAEVNIANIDSSLFGGHLYIYGVQVTDKEQPEQNIIEIGAIKFKFLWDALLRAKFVVEESSIKTIQLYSKRKSPGRILPVEKETKSKPSAIDDVEKSALKTAQDEYEENVLGDVAKVLGGVNPTDQLENMKKELQSDKKINEVKTALQEKQKEWDSRIKNLPNSEKLKGLEARFKQLKFNTKNIPEFLNDVKEADKIKKEADTYLKEISEAAKNADSDYKGLNKDIKSIDDFVKQDIADLQKKLKIPSFDVGDLSQKIFLKVLQDKLGPYAKYLDVAKKYMPPKKPKEAKDHHKKEVLEKRQIGHTFQFPITVSYPLFWLKKAVISSKSTEKGLSGDIEGLIQNLTSDPVSLKKPATIDFKGDFPKQNVHGLDVTIILDHTTDDPKDSFSGVVSSYPAGRQVLSGSKDLTFVIDESHGQSKFSGYKYKDQLEVKINNKFTNVKYEIDANNKDVKNIFTAAVADIPEITLNATAKGVFPKLNWSINSNLGQELGRSLKKQVQKKIDDAREKLNAFVQSRISGEKEKLNGEFNKFKGQIDGKVNSAKNDFEKSKKDIENKVNSEQKNSQKSQKKNIEKKALDSLKKKFKF